MSQEYLCPEYSTNYQQRDNAQDKECQHPGKDESNHKSNRHADKRLNQCGQPSTSSLCERVHVCECVGVERKNGQGDFFRD